MKFFRSIALFTFASLALFAGNTEIINDVIQKGQTSTQLLLKTLGSNMKAHMKHGGPMEALDFCSQEAYTLTEKVNKELPKGVSVKRVSLKNRSTLNTPTEDEAIVLKSLKKMEKEHQALPKKLVQQVDEHTYKFYKPLIIEKAVCLKCHGEVQNKTLKDEISKRYPNDKALHYKMGDLRGAVVTTVIK